MTEVHLCRCVGLLAVWLIQWRVYCNIQRYKWDTTAMLATGLVGFLLGFVVRHSFRIFLNVDIALQ
jgi:hypothetical protein